MLSRSDISSTALQTSQPSCAQSCWLSATATGNCYSGVPSSIRDCVCTNISLLSLLSTCVQKSCSFSDQLVHIDVLTAVCDGYDKPSRKAELIILAAVGMTLATVMGALRCWSRLVTIRRLGWDDGTALAALLLLLVMGSVGMVATRWGFGLHHWDSNIRLSQTIHQVFWAMEIGYLLNINLIKASIMLLYGRTFETNGLQTFVRYSLLFVAARTVIFLFLLIFQCRPMRAIWDPDEDGVCLNMSAIGFAGAACSIIQDFVLMIAPVPTLWRLELPKTKRLLLAVLFGFGSIATITSLIRLKALQTLGRTKDLTWDNVDVVIWSGIELVSALVCASIPPSWPLLKRSYEALFYKASSVLQDTPTPPQEHRRSDFFEMESTDGKYRMSAAFKKKAPSVMTAGSTSEIQIGYVCEEGYRFSPPPPMYRAEA